MSGPDDGPDQRPMVSSTEITAQSQQVAVRGHALRRIAIDVLVYGPRPVAQPQVDPALPDLGLADRIVEVLRYNATSLEYAVGPDGAVRAVMFTSLRVLLFVIFPLLVVLVCVAACVPIFGSLASICTDLKTSARSLFWAAVFGLGVVVVMPVIIAWCLLIWRAGKQLTSK